MDYLFIDTSTFISENYLEGKRIKEIFTLAYDGHVKLVIPIITLTEILNHIKIDVSKGLSGESDFRNKTRVLRNIPELLSRFEKINLEAASENITSLFLERINSTEPELLPYPTIDVESIFKKYFSSEYPFGGSKKKNEFPDAFALATIEEWCIKNNRKCYIISLDKDIVNFKSKHFKSISFDHYIDVTIKRISQKAIQKQRIAKAYEIYAKKKPELEKDIENWLRERLNDIRFYQSYDFDSIESIRIENIRVELEDITVLGVTEYNVQLNTFANISFEVQLGLTADYDPSDWDDDYVEEEISQDIRISISLEADIPLAGDKYMEIKVGEINNGKELEF